MSEVKKWVNHPHTGGAKAITHHLPQLSNALQDSEQELPQKTQCVKNSSAEEDTEVLVGLS